MSDITIVKLEHVIIKYPKLFVPKHIMKSPDKKFSAMFVLPANYDWTLTKNALYQASVNKFGQALDGLTNTLNPGQAEGFPGQYVLNTNAYEESPPNVKDSMLQEILDSSQIFGGCIVDAVVHFKGYEFEGKKGIRCDLKIVVLRDNVNVTRLDDSSLEAEDYFQPVAGAPTQTAQSPANVMQPVVQQPVVQQPVVQQPAGAVAPGAPANTAPVPNDPWNA